MKFSTFFRRSAYDFWIIGAAIILLLFGLFMIASATMGSYAGENSILIATIIRQVVYCLGSLLMLWFFSRVAVIDFRQKIVEYGALALMISLLLPRLLGMGTSGAYGWLTIGPISLQLSEFMKVCAIVYIAKMLSKNYKSVYEARKVYLKIILLVFVVTGIIIGWQRDTGSGIVFFCMCALMLLVPKSKLYERIRKWVFYATILGLVVIVVFITPIGTALASLFDSNNYIVGRFLASANPFLYPFTIGYHLILSFVSFASGGWFGMGYANSVHKYMNFPNADNDFILAIIVEELGFVGFLFLFLLYAVIIVRLMKHALDKKSDTRAQIVYVGVMAYLVLHFFFNAGGVSGLIPLTGVPLLLVSAGGSSIIATMMAIGLAENEIKRIRLKEDANRRRN